MKQKILQEFQDNKDEVNFNQNDQSIMMATNGGMISDR